MNAEMPHVSSTAYMSNTLQGLGDYKDYTMAAFKQDLATVKIPHLHPAEKPMPNPTPSRRLVQVFIADPDENVPLEQSLLYTGTQKLTDATDQELFFEIDIKAILEKHNKARIGLVNKNVKERTEYLEPARVRDLRMVVTTIATF